VSGIKYPRWCNNSTDGGAFYMYSGEKETGGQEQSDQIREFGSSVTYSQKGVIHCLTIVGQIEGHQILSETTKTTKYEHVMPLLAAVEESDEVEGLLVLLNTVGGDVEAGLGIAELIASMTKPTASVVLGGGHSIGVPLAVAASRSMIVPSASMTIHPVRMNGVVIGVPQTFRYFDKIQERITRFVTQNSQISEERFRRLMFCTDEMANDVGSIIDGEEAVAAGLIDQLGGLSDALGYLHTEIQKRREARGVETPESNVPTTGEEK
jgi:ATP-dependent protease ClpP protease subunit